MASGSHDNTVRIWDAATGQLQREPKGHSSGVNSVAFSPNSERVASRSHDNTVRIWDTATGQLRRELSSSTQPVAFSPNGTRVTNGDWHAVRIWDVATGQLQRELKRHSSFVTSVAFSPNGMRVVSGSYDNTVRIWHAHSRSHPTARDASGQLHDFQGRARRSFIRDLVDLAGFDDHMKHKFEQLCLGEKN